MIDVVKSANSSLKAAQKGGAKGKRGRLLLIFRVDCLLRLSFVSLPVLFFRR